jgi:tetratricopeptide (TPR) repeat protein
METDKSRAEEYYQKGVMSLEKNQYDYAIQHFKLALALDQSLRNARSGILLARSRKLKTASASQNSLNFHAGLYLWKAFFFETIKKLEKACDFYEDSLAIMEPKPAVYLRLGEIYSRLNQLGDAMDNLQNALKLIPDYSPALRDLGEIYLKQGRLKEARSAFDHYLKFVPHDSKILSELKNIEAMLTIERGRLQA